MELYGDGLQRDLLGRVHKYQILMYTWKIETPGYQYYHNSNTYIHTFVHMYICTCIHTYIHYMTWENEE